MSTIGAGTVATVLCLIRGRRNTRNQTDGGGLEGVKFVSPNAIADALLPLAKISATNTTTNEIKNVRIATFKHSAQVVCQALTTR